MNNNILTINQELTLLKKNIILLDNGYIDTKSYKLNRIKKIDNENNYKLQFFFKEDKDFHYKTFITIEKRELYYNLIIKNILLNEKNRL